jgi:hypothetical protein
MFLLVSGQLLADDEVPAIFLENPAGYLPNCKLVALPSLTSDPGEGSTEHAWNKFHFAAAVLPNTSARLYFVVYNVPFPDNTGNYTGFRVEFTSAYLTTE